MADRELTRAEIASEHEAAVIRSMTHDDGRVGEFAQAAAILALCQRVADLTERLEKALGEYLGDDSNLDQVAQALRAIAEPD